VGFTERPERVVLIILGALFNRWGVMAPVLWVLAVLSTITVIHRISYTYQRTKPQLAQPQTAEIPSAELRPQGSPATAARAATADLTPAPRA
jgi:CDP-diacylglycerol--glycerol-3-phosphate 3-phosphatidyltransferase